MDEQPKRPVYSRFSAYDVEQVWHDYRLSILTHLQKLLRGLTIRPSHERHERVQLAIRRRVIQTVEDRSDLGMIK
ncbi:MAG: hypothetical protein CME19_03980 [Gemmatimonadetes bacterium]|nr:hypothetical protein [Gemmatimonadota bacterium]